MDVPWKNTPPSTDKNHVRFLTHLSEFSPRKKNPIKKQHGKTPEIENEEFKKMEVGLFSRYNHGCALEKYPTFNWQKPRPISDAFIRIFSLKKDPSKNHLQVKNTRHQQ